MSSDGFWNVLGSAISGIFGSKKGKQEAAIAKSQAEIERLRLQQKTIELQAAKEKGKLWIVLAVVGATVLMFAIFFLVRKRR